jgi:hypothetical protein
MRRCAKCPAEIPEDRPDYYCNDCRAAYSRARYAETMSPRKLLKAAKEAADELEAITKGWGKA